MRIQVNREIYLEHTEDFLRAAVLEDGELCEIHIEQLAETKLTECLFWGKVMQIRPSVCAAFVDIGLEQNAFLPLREGSPLKCGDWIIVQGAAKLPTETKGLRLTDRINLAGKWLVLTPECPGVHVSKKIKDEEFKQELKQFAQEICPENCGLIVRTASAEITQDAMQAEANALYEAWQGVCEKAKGMVRPGILLEPEGLEIRLIRDLADASLIRVTTNSRASFNRLTDMQASGLIHQEAQIAFDEEKDRLMFDAFGIEAACEKAFRKRVWLPCGGYLVIDPCEAMTVIDVNSGKMSIGRGIEQTAVRVNMEAAREAARQMRLRDMGGIVVIDFIDMREEEHKKALVHALKQHVLRDSSPVKVEGMTRLGLVELTRKRKGPGLYRQTRASCSYCSGAGELLSAQEVARRALASVRRMAISGQRGPFVIKAPAAAFKALASMHAPCTGYDVYVLEMAGKHAERFEIEQTEASRLPHGAQRMPWKDGER